MAILQVAVLAMVALAYTASGQRNCSEYLMNYCKCRENPQQAREDYDQEYDKYYSHLYDLRRDLRSSFGSWIDQALRTSACPNRLCHYLSDYEDVLIKRCGHCILGCEYEPVWRNDYRHKLEQDVCAWIVIHGPVLCQENADHNHDHCDFEGYVRETYKAINATCRGRCPV